ncbi:MAG: hypothetical protein CSA74_01720 [Rhodobacterales bacterium]|nr:MAG: hypothetical protein CSA74_01720 [Rhodobacterales bacterium]
MTSMTDPGYAQTRQPLGVGRLLGDSLSILFRRFVTVFLICILPIAVSLGASSMWLGWKAALGLEEPDPNMFIEADSSLWIRFAFMLLVQFAIYGITTALLVQLAYDVKLGRARSIGAYFGPALRSAAPIVILMSVVMILVGFGTAALIIPGLWIFAVFYVTTPVIVIERAGFRAMGRSAKLTKGYRWPIVGLFVLLSVVVFMISFAVTFVAGSAAYATEGTGALSVAIVLLITSIMQTAFFGLSSIVNALVFARLKEVKEGIGVDQLAEVFD